LRVRTIRKTVFGSTKPGPSFELFLLLLSAGLALWVTQNQRGTAETVDEALPSGSAAKVSF